MWCKNCNRVTDDRTCELCGTSTDENVPQEVFWCNFCKTPIIKVASELNKNICTICGAETSYLSADLRPVFPEERLLLEVLTAEPFEYAEKSVWAYNNRYFIDGELKQISAKHYKYTIAEHVRKQLEELSIANDYTFFNNYIEKFKEANQDRLNFLKYEAHNFIQTTAKDYPEEHIVVSFSGGKDSSVTADLTIRALSNPSLVHIFGDTTLEFPHTLEYAKRYRENNPRTVFRIAKNEEQDFYSVCNDIGPPARLLRWCCSMFKTGPITRVLNRMYKDKDILTFYGIRKYESVSRSKYNRVEDDPESIKIHKQKVASPIFLWKDIDVWLYILNEDIDFNDAYRLGYDRVGCWCCPNNNLRAQFLSQIYMPDRSNKWRSFLIEFAKKIGKPDAEVYVDTGKWKARQGGNGLATADDIIIKFTNCTAEENARIYKLNKPADDSFIQLFIPFGKIATELGRKLIDETIVLDIRTNVPILSIQPLANNKFEYSVKVKTMNVSDHDDLQRMVSYQVKKYNACRQCLKCESLCRFGAISIRNDKYMIDDKKCKRCRMCITAKYINGGCLMDKYLKTRI